MTTRLLTEATPAQLEAIKKVHKFLRTIKEYKKEAEQLRLFLELNKKV